MSEEATFDPTMKKKKKKPKAPATEQPAEETPGEGGGDSKVEDIPATMDFGKKKKKKKEPKEIAEDASATPAEDEGGTPDYTYSELLDRVYNIMREKNPGFDTGEKKTFMMKPPSVMRVGSKKTAFANFAEICRLLKRTPKHLLQFLTAELGTSASVDGNNCLIIKGRYQQKHIENILRKYIKEYVTCHTCKSPHTTLNKDTRLFFLQCETCGSRCSVTAIKTGFQAITGKRAAQKQN